MRIVLFVDADEEMREMWKRILDDEGYWVVLAGDWSGAAKAIRREHPDLVVSGPHVGPDAWEAEARTLMEQRGIAAISCPAAASHPSGLNWKDALAPAQGQGEDAPGCLTDMIDGILAQREESMSARRPGTA